MLKWMLYYYQDSPEAPDALRKLTEKWTENNVLVQLLIKVNHGSTLKASSPRNSIVLSQMEKAACILPCLLRSKIKFL